MLLRAGTTALGSHSGTILCWGLEASGPGAHTCSPMSCTGSWELRCQLWAPVWICQVGSLQGGEAESNPFNRLSGDSEVHQSSRQAPLCHQQEPHKAFLPVTHSLHPKLMLVVSVQPETLVELWAFIVFFHLPLHLSPSSGGPAHKQM